ncbi:hypothetical protein CAMRE0001_2537 [Campylobacter rectus RM3267]|uniref:Uncharacterized protein n=1 Tax=Campylobacter rectus RM3267 TaxID=553218 RepID=B9D3S3_CAMRE|nr:hypothetical protein CAMRE0001_2537 [Campylobacter rectus RM3267]
MTTRKFNPVLRANLRVGLSSLNSVANLNELNLIPNLTRKSNDQTHAGRQPRRDLA